MGAFKQAWVVFCVVVAGSILSACLEPEEAIEDPEIASTLPVSSQEDVEDIAEELVAPDGDGEELAAAQDFDVQAQACCGSVRQCAPPVCHMELRCQTWPPRCWYEQVCDPPVCHDEPLSCVGPAPCSHSTCTEGAPLNPTCDLSVAQICREDWWCCSNRWDDICVRKVGTIAGRSCAGCN